MRLTELLVGRLAEAPRIAITGCGGKTSLMIALAEEYAQRGRSVLVTTTTKVRSPYELDYGCDIIQLDRYDGVPTPGRRVFFAATLDESNGRKVCASALTELAKVATGFDVVLMEADGSRGLPLKYHNPWDPVIPDFTTDVIAMVGMSALGRPLDDAVMFNYPSYAAVVQNPEPVVTERTISNLLRLDEGIKKGFSGGTGSSTRQGMVLFNQCDILDAVRLARVMALVGDEHLYGSVERNIVYANL